MHDFLYDIEEELRKFRRVTIISVVALIFIILALSRFIFIRFRISPRFLSSRFLFGGFFLDFIIILIAFACLFYSIYALIGQQAFLKRWGDRFKKLYAIEQELLDEK